MRSDEGNSLGMRITRIVRWSLAAVILGFGLWTLDQDSRFWAALATFLFSVPLVFQATPWPLVRTYALWFGLFLVAQSWLSPLIKRDYLTLRPGMHITVDVRTPDGPGLPPGLRHITTDENGFRVVPRIDYARKAGVRIFAIGGSTTEDIILDDSTTWAHLLQNGLAARNVKAEVVNTGLSGLRAQNHLATLKAIAGYSPDLVIFLVGGNDWNKQIKDKFEPSVGGKKPPYLRDSPFGEILQSFVVWPLQDRFMGKTGSSKNLIVDQPDGFNSDKQRHSLDRPTRHLFRPSEVAAGYREDLAEISRTCRDKALQCMFLTQPHAYSHSAPQELLRLFWMTPPYADYSLDLDSMIYIAALYNKFLLEFSRQNGHASCDVAAGLEPSVRLFYDDMHYTNEGARRVAEMALPCVLKALNKSGRAD